MFGIIRPCRHRLSEHLHGEWIAQLCGLCLALRDEHGQLARAATNHDGLVISALVEAQNSVPATRRNAGPCPLRGMRRAEVAHGAGPRLAATVSLVLASAKLRDHAEDGDGAFRHTAVGTLGRSVARRWVAHAGRTGTGMGLDTAVLTEAIEGQAAVEHALGQGDSILSATEPTELATAAAFGHTALLTGRADNAPVLREVGRLFGRTAHLLDAVEDADTDVATGAWNPLTSTGTTLQEARRLCDDAVRGVRLALAEAAFSAPALVHALLVHELPHAVRRTFGHAGQPPGPAGPHSGQAHGGHPDPSGTAAGGYDPSGGGPDPSGGGPGPNGPPPGNVPPTKERKDEPQDGQGGCCWVPKFRVPPRPRNAAVGCLLVPYMCCTCQFCCRNPYPGPCDGKPNDACCDGNCCSIPDCGCCCDCSC